MHLLGTGVVTNTSGCLVARAYRPWGASSEETAAGGAREEEMSEVRRTGFQVKLDQ